MSVSVPINMTDAFPRKWAGRLDKFWAMTGIVIPAGLVLGRVAFEAAISLVGLCWINRLFWLEKIPLDDPPNIL